MQSQKLIPIQSDDDAKCDCIFIAPVLSDNSQAHSQDTTTTSASASETCEDKGSSCMCGKHVGKVKFEHAHT